MTTYRIQITREETAIKKTKEYQRVADSGNQRDGGAIYEYVDVDLPSTNSTEILDMRVNDLEVGDVISHIISLSTQK